MIVTSDAVQVHLIRRFPAFSKQERMFACLYKSRASKIKAITFMDNISHQKIKSRRLLEVGEPNQRSATIVKSDAMQTHLIRRFPAFSKQERMFACLYKSRASKIKAITFMDNISHQKIKSRRLLEVGEPNQRSTTIVKSDAVQARLIRKCRHSQSE